MLATGYILISVLLLALGLYKRWYFLSGLSYLAFMVVFCAIAPLPGEEKKVRISPTQVVFRFDAHRYLQLTGSGCEGKLYYIDDQKFVYNELAVHSARVLTEPFAHTAGDYIFIPYSDYNGTRYSQDGGRKFTSITISPFADIHRPRREQVKSTAVVDNQLFMETTSGIYRSPKPFGSHIAVDVLSPQKIDEWIGYYRYDGERWRGDATKMPAVPADYQGWYHWQCDVNKEQYETVFNPYAPFLTLQASLRQWIGSANKRAQ